jgi:phytoene dehydrogenase-like protein
MSRAVVVGGGPAAVRAAAFLRRGGRDVVLLQEGAFAGGVAHADQVVGRGVGGAPESDAFGAFQAVDIDAGVTMGGKVRRLPLTRPQVLAMVPAARLPGAAGAWARARGTIELARLLGGGRELRTYRDWVVQKFGVPVFDALYASYCHKRWGGPEELTCNVARLHHGTPLPSAPSAPSAGPAGLLDVDGVAVHLGVRVTAVATGRVDTSEGTFEGDVFVDASPPRVGRWLGDAASAELRNTIAPLRLRHALEVRVTGGAELPFETHVLDAGVPFYRMVRHDRLPGGTGLSVQFSLEPHDPLWAAPDGQVVATVDEGLAACGVKDASSANASILRLSDHHPVWTGTHLTRMRTWLLALDDLEITPIGNAGLFSPLDLAQEAAWLQAIGDKRTLRQRLRDIVEPPVLEPGDRTRLTRFIER